MKYRDMFKKRNKIAVVPYFYVGLTWSLSLIEVLKLGGIGELYM